MFFLIIYQNISSDYLWAYSVLVRHIENIYQDYDKTYNQKLKKIDLSALKEPFFWIYKLSKK